jgi:hypothetical protein
MKKYNVQVKRLKLRGNEGESEKRDMHEKKQRREN